MNHIRYLLTAIAAALIAAGEVFKDYAENTPETDEDGVVVDTTTAGSTERDSAGLPWHPQIHASTKSKKADGTWTRKKGVDDVTFNRIVAELQAQVGTVQVAATPAAAPAPTASVGPATLKPPTLAPVVKNDYEKLCDWIASKASDPTMTEWINRSFVENNVTLADLAGNLPAAKAWLDAFTAQ